MLESGNRSAITVAVARTEDEWKSGLGFVDGVYRQTYDSHWLARPDVLFVARDEDGPVATAGLELGRLRPCVDTERYFHLSPQMSRFIQRHRECIAEFGRFSCDPRASVVGSQAVLRAALKYCVAQGVDYLFAWARPAVARHGASQLGVPFWTLDIPLDEATIRSCESWTAPPVKFFFGGETPRLLLAVIPFFDVVIQRLDSELEGLVDDRTSLTMEEVPVGR